MQRLLPNFERAGGVIICKMVAPRISKILVFVLLCAALAASASQQDDLHPTNLKRPAGENGVWGGVGIKLTPTATGAELQFDCAQGTIEKQIALKDGSRFHARGRFTPGTHGPVREDALPKPHPATFEGSVKGKTLSFTVHEDGHVESYTLENGAAAVIRECR